MNQRLWLGMLTLALTFVVCAQRHVDPRNTNDRIIAVVPLTGSETDADPKCPQYAPWPLTQGPNGILGFVFQPNDDVKSAVVEFVAQNRAAFAAILALRLSRSTKEAATPSQLLKTASNKL